MSNPATIPTPRSYPQVLQDIIDAFTSRCGIPILKVGSPTLSSLEAAARSDVRNAEDIFNLLMADSLDAQTGNALDRTGQADGAPRILIGPATGTVTIGDSTYTKISTQIYQGTAAPIAGLSSINVTDGSLFPIPSGPTHQYIYIGRGTSNYEGRLEYTNVVNHTSYWTIVLTGNTNKFHNLGETVVLAQGGRRNIGAGTIVQTPQANLADAIQFSLLYSTYIEDGEVSVEGVQVTALVGGTIGNVSSGSIKEFSSSAPFTGAIVTNPLPFSTGTDTEDDDTYRERIRTVRSSKTIGGTDIAITSAVIGITAQDENKSVASSSIVNRKNYPTILYIDDGSGYEEISDGVAIEVLVDQAAGGEDALELSSSNPVTKAFAESTLSAPFNIHDKDRLAFIVGGVFSEHCFASTDFLSEGNGSAYEVVGSINSDAALLWQARTSHGGTQVVITAKADDNEDLQLATATASDCSEYFGFPSNFIQTCALYKNDRLLTKDGRLASLTSAAIDSWGAISGSQTFTCEIDNTPSTTYTFTPQNFIDAGTGFIAVGRNTPQAWVDVFNLKIPGITAAITSAGFSITSNRGRSSLARVKITGGTLVTSVAMFAVDDSIGVTSDYALNRNVSQLCVTPALTALDRLTAGSIWTRGFVEANITAPLTLTSAANLWWAVDGAAELVQTATNSYSTIAPSVTAVTSWGYRLRFTSAVASDYENVQVGDHVIFWDPNFDSSLLDRTWRVGNVDTSVNYQWFETERTCMPYPNAFGEAVTLTDGKVFVCGGYIGYYSSSKDITASAALYDPILKEWTLLPPMTVARARHTATLLASGKVFVFGGLTNNAGTTYTAVGEIYDPTTNTWATAPSSGAPSARAKHTATLLSDGTVLIAGGLTGSGATTTCAIYDSAGAGSWTNTGALIQGRFNHAACLLSSNNVMIAGGEKTTAADTLNTIEVYNFAGGTWGNDGTISVKRQGAKAVSLGAITALIVGGSTTIESGINIGSVVTDLFTEGAGSVATGSLNNSAVFHSVLMGGSTPICGFGHKGSATPKVEYYNAGVWSASTNPPMGGTMDRIGVCASVLSTGNILYFGGWTHPAGVPIASHEEYVVATSTWLQPDPTAGTTITTPSAGLSFVRATSPLQLSTVAAGTYTADSLVSAIALTGAYDAAFQTTKFRASTNTFVGGDIGMVAADTMGQAILAPADAIVSSLSHLGSVESGGSELDTPTFMPSAILGPYDPSVDGLAIYWPSASPFPLSAKCIMTASLDAIDSWPFLQNRYGANKGIKTSLAFSGSTATYPYVVTTITNDNPWTPLERVYFANPFSMGPEDSLSFLADGDAETKSFAPNLYRRATPVAATTYGSDITLSDAEIADSFGISFGQPTAFDFTDFSLYMRARGQSHVGTANKAILWRFWRYGAEGEIGKVRYTLPSLPSQAVTVDMDNSDGNLNTNIVLASGVAKTGYVVRPSTKIGMAAISDTLGAALVDYVVGFTVASANRAAGFTTLKLTLPGGITNHGFVAGNQIFFNYTGGVLPNPFVSGRYYITSTSGSGFGILDQITFADGGGASSNPAPCGDVSFDNAAASFTGAGIVVGDFFRLETLAGAPNHLTNQTMYCRIVGDQHVQGYIPTDGTEALSYTVTWVTLGDSSNLSFLTNPAQSANTIMTAVNQLCRTNNPNGTNLISPIYGTLLGSGAGLISMATFDELTDNTYYYSLYDGINYIQSNVYDVPSGEYVFTLKNPITGSLSTDNDWLNEELRLAPSTAQNVADWLSELAVCGASSACLIQPSSQASKVQISTLTPGSVGSIQVQGGTANTALASVEGSPESILTPLYMSVPIHNTNATGFYGGQWVSIDNTEYLSRGTGVSGSIGISATTNLTSINTYGGFTFNVAGGKVWDFSTSSPAKISNALLLVEKQGNFMAYRDIGQGTSLVLGKEGEYVVIEPPSSPSGGNTPQMATVNTGIFKVVRVQGTTDEGTGVFWIENPAGVEAQAAECDIKFITEDSTLPGDKLKIYTSIWGVDNIGEWEILTVGLGSAKNFATGFQWSFTVNVSATPITAFTGSSALGSSYQQVQILEGAPQRYIKQIRSISPNQTDSDLADILFLSDVGYSRISPSAGSVITALGKLDFPTTLASGVDGYRHSTGLIGEVAKVLYSDPSDPITYPGIVASTGLINISGPSIRRIQIGLQARVKTGTNLQVISDALKSAIATVVNKTGVGESISFLDLVAACKKVVGVVSVVITSPVYAIGSDMISVQAHEKPMVLDLNNDITVTFIGV